MEPDNDNILKYEDIPTVSAIAEHLLVLEEEIGHSGNAHVFKAFHKRLGKNVAAKIIECVDSKEAWDMYGPRVQRECRHWNVFSEKSEYVLPLHDLVIERTTLAGRSFIAITFVIQLCPAGDLKQFIHRSSKTGLNLTASRFREFLLHICDAIQAGHEVNKLHKDIKASNVLLIERGKAPNGTPLLSPRLTDFGISQEVFDNQGCREGTPEYMPPEAFDDDYKPDRPGDIYSLGILFIEAITGAPPYRAPAGSATERFKMYATLHRSGDIKYADIEKRLQQPMTTLIRRMVSIVPEKRPSIEEIIAELNHQMTLAATIEITEAESKRLVLNHYRWNPLIHISLGEELHYYFLRGRNPRNDDRWIMSNLKSKDIFGFSLFRVVGGFDYVLRIWVHSSKTLRAIEEVLNQFERFNGGSYSKFNVLGIKSIGSKEVEDENHFEEANVAQLIFESLNSDKNEEEVGLKSRSLIVGSINESEHKRDFPIRVFTAFAFAGAATGGRRMPFRFHAGDAFKTLRSFERRQFLAGFSIYHGNGEFGLLVKMRLKRFQDYEFVLEPLIDAIASVEPSYLVSTQTFIELNRESIHRSDDGSVWLSVEEYRRDAGLAYPTD